MRSQDDVDSECVSSVGEDCKDAEFIGNKQVHSLTHSLTYTQLYIFYTDVRSLPYPREK